MKDGGLNMINIRNVIHALHVKWMKCFSDDQGRTWSRNIWLKFEQILPPSLIAGLTGITEQEIAPLPPFNQTILRSYALVNSLFYAQNPGLPIPYNLYGTKLHPRINHLWVEAGVFTANDVPTEDGCIDLARLRSKFVHIPSNFYLFCCSLQQSLGRHITSVIPGIPQVNELLILQSKVLLQSSGSQTLSLEY